MPPVPRTNTSSPAEPRPDKFTIPFKPELIDLILTGQKIKTYRYGIKFDYLKVGDTVKIQNSKSKEIVGTARVTDKTSSTFIDLPVAIPGHEPYQSKDHQRQVFSGYYSYINRSIEDSDPFLVIEFQLKDKRNG